MRTDPATTAFLFLDFQYDVCKKGGGMVKNDPEILDRFDQTIQTTAVFLKNLRNLDPQPLTIHVQHEFTQNYPELQKTVLSKMEQSMLNSRSFESGREKTNIVSELIPAPGEFLLKKHSLSVFATTELSWMLNKHQVRTVVLSGVVTHYAVLAAAFSAYDSGLSVVVAQDCYMSGGLQMHETALKILNPVSELSSSTELLNGLIQSSRKRRPEK